MTKMGPQDTKNYLQQLKRSEAMNKINKEKEMQREIMMLKNENAQLKEEIRQFANGLGIIAHQLKESTRENEQLKKRIEACDKVRVGKFIS